MAGGAGRGHGADTCVPALVPRLAGGQSQHPLTIPMSSLAHIVLPRSPHLWKDPDTFRPERFAERFENPAFEGRWAGYDPELQGNSLYPNEVASDFALLPFGKSCRLTGLSTAPPAT